MKNIEGKDSSSEVFINSMANLHSRSIGGERKFGGFVSF